jgi:hypothetical protein
MVEEAIDPFPEPLPGTSWQRISPYMPALVSCALVVACCSQVHTGFMAVCLLPFLMLWFCWRLISCLWRPGNLFPLFINTGIWITGGLLIALARGHHAQVARDEANHLVALAEQYQQQHGKYPPSMSAMGLPEPGGSITSQPHYLFSQGEPHLFYMATFFPLDSYSYDFGKHRWEFHPD